jgi:hypothetical protein
MLSRIIINTKEKEVKEKLGPKHKQTNAPHIDF